MTIVHEYMFFYHALIQSILKCLFYTIKQSKTWETPPFLLNDAKGEIFH